jgi:hypothetical protein
MQILRARSILSLLDVETAEVYPITMLLSRLEGVFAIKRSKNRA